MKIKLLFSLSILLSLILGSCASTNDVTGNGFLQKRKYNKGFYLNRQSSEKSVSQTKEDKDLLRTEEFAATKSTGNTSLPMEEVAENSENVEMLYTSSSNAMDNAADLPFSDENAADSKSERNEIPLNEERDEKKIAEENENELDRSNNSPAADADGMFILAVIFAILIPPLGVLIYTNIDWMKVLICLLLTFLFFLPGMIYALLVVFDVL